MLEVIDALVVFGVVYVDMDVVVHPDWFVLWLVEYTDGWTIADLSMADMRLPFGFALGYRLRISTAFGTIDWTSLSRLDFEPPDTATFRCLTLAYEAGRVGGTAPAWLSAANEVAVDAFLDGLMRWVQIADVCAEVLDAHDGAIPDTVSDVIEADATARRHAEAAIAALT